jgi:hypothetical protein
MTGTRIVVAGVLAAALMSGAYAEQGAPQTGTPLQTPGAGRGRGAGRGAGGAGIGSSEVAPLLFEERWTSLPNAQPITQEHLSNQHLRLHLYGDIAAIRKSNHEPEYYTYTGEARTNWALTVSDPANLWDLSRSRQGHAAHAQYRLAVHACRHQDGGRQLFSRARKGPANPRRG